MWLSELLFCGVSLIRICLFELLIWLVRKFWCEVRFFMVLEMFFCVWFVEFVVIIRIVVRLVKFLDILIFFFGVNVIVFVG